MSFLTAILLAGCLQAVALATALLGAKNKGRAEILLGAWMLTFAVDLGCIVLVADGRFRDFPFLLHATTPFAFLYGPFYYSFVRAAASPKARFRARDLLHLAPFAAAFLGFLPFYLMPAADKVALFASSLAAEPSWMMAAQIAARALQGTVYVLLGMKAARTLRSRWMTAFSWSQAAIWAAVWLSLALLPLAPGGSALITSWIWPLGAASVFMLGFLSMRRSRFLPDGTQVRPAEKYGKTKLGAEEAELLVTRVREALEVRKLYLDPDLDLTGFAAGLGARRDQVSQVLNARMGASFSALVNRLRVEEAKRLLLAPEGLGALDIAFRCGFSSKTAFNDSFRRLAGCSPSEFRKKGPDR